MMAASSSSVFQQKAGYLSSTQPTGAGSGGGIEPHRLSRVPTKLPPNLGEKKGTASALGHRSSVCVVHVAPFLLTSGSIEPKIRRATVDRFESLRNAIFD